MRICVIGGMARSLINFRGPLLQRMAESGHEVTACAPENDRLVQTQLKEMGVNYRQVNLERAGINPVRDLISLIELVRLFREIQPDIVLSYTAKPVIWGGLAARLLSIQHYYAMITGLGFAFTDNSRLRQRAFRRVQVGLYRGALRRADAVFFQNPDDEAEFRDRGLLHHSSSIVQINGSGVDLSYFEPQPLQNKPVFLLMARLIADKGIREYREVARLLRQRYPQARFLLAGGLDPNPASIGKKELGHWQDERDVEYLGALEDVRAALAQCTVYVLPSYYREGIPRSVLEAMATGRAIITSDAPGCRETVQDGVNGYLVPPKDINALASAMELFIENPELCQTMGAESLRLCREKYDVNKVNKVILDAMGL